VATDRDCNGNPDNDQDGDGHVRDDPVGGWTTCGGDDCDDTDSDIYPGAADLVCDQVDGDCDGDLFDQPGADDDDDGYLDGDPLDDDCGGDDCDDSSARTNPGSPIPDVCTADDYDCDGVADPLDVLNIVEVDDTTDSLNGRVAMDWSGSEFGLVWVDDRTGLDQLWFRRLDPTGSPLGSSVRVHAQSFEQESPDIAWSGSRWGVVWSMYDSDGFCWLAYFATLDPTGGGMLPSPTPTHLTYSDDIQRDPKPRIAGSGSDYGIVWQRHNGSNYVPPYFNRGFSDGTVEMRSNFSGEEMDVEEPRTPSIAWGGSVYGIAWVGLDYTSAASEPYALVPMFDWVDPESRQNKYEIRLQTATNGEQAAYTPDIAGGSVIVDTDPEPGFGVVWTWVTTTPPEVRGTVVAIRDDHATSGDAGLVGSIDHETPSIAYNGVEFGVTYVDIATYAGPAALFTIMSETGTGTGDETRIDFPNATYPDLAWNGSMFGAAWRHPWEAEVWFTPMVCTY
jgi:hypothetical protein